MKPRTPTLIRNVLGAQTVGVLATALVPAAARAQSTAANTVIRNKASVTYKDAGSVTQSAESL